MLAFAGGTAEASTRCREARRPAPYEGMEVLAQPRGSGEVRDEGQFRGVPRPGRVLREGAAPTSGWGFGTAERVQTHLRRLRPRPEANSGQTQIAVTASVTNSGDLPRRSRRALLAPRN
jgi:hypothetical protein